jgi:hypothetical protein
MKIAEKWMEMDGNGWKWRCAMLPPHIQGKLAELRGKGRGAHYRPLIR